MALYRCSVIEEPTPPAPVYSNYTISWNVAVGSDGSRFGTAYIRNGALSGDTTLSATATSGIPSATAKITGIRSSTRNFTEGYKLVGINTADEDATPIFERFDMTAEELEEMKKEMKTYFDDIE